VAYIAAFIKTFTQKNTEDKLYYMLGSLLLEVLLTTFCIHVHRLLTGQDSG